jgi:hypothetical protein
MSISEKKYNESLIEYLLLKLNKSNESHIPYIEELGNKPNLTSYYIYNISKILNMNMTYLNREIEEFLLNKEEKIFEHMVMKYYSAYKLIDNKLVDSNNKETQIKNILRDTSEIFNKPIRYLHILFIQYLELNFNFGVIQNNRKIYTKLYGGLNTTIDRRRYDIEVLYRKEIIKKLSTELLHPGLENSDNLANDALSSYKHIILLMQEFGFVEQTMYSSATFDPIARFVPFYEEF